MAIKPAAIENFDPTVFAQHRRWMNRALSMAQAAGTAGDIPVGAVIVNAAGGLIAVAGNRKERDGDPTAHAEILVLRAAAEKLRRWQLNDCTLYVTLEPCPMCAGAIVQARIKLLVYGASDLKTGAVRTVLNLPDHACSYHGLSVVAGVEELACQQLLQQWFTQHRIKKRQETRSP